MMNAEDQLQQPFLGSSDGAPSNNELRNAAQATSVPQQFHVNRTAGEDPCITVIKRIHSQLALIVMFANTITTVFSISAAVSLIPDDGAASLYSFCDYGDDGAQVLVQCPYIPSPVFQSFLTIWSVYFVSFFAYRYYETSLYETNDLRFYVYCDKFNSSIVNRAMIVMGLILTFVSAIGAATFVVHNGTTDSIGPILVFICVNIFNLVHMGLCKFTVLGKLDMTRTEAFRTPTVIDTEPMWSLLNFNGLFISHRALFEHIGDALTASLLTGNDKHVAAIGDVAQIKMVMKTLNPLQNVK